MLAETKLDDLQFVVARKAIGYCRVSSDDQADHGTSLETQKEGIEQYAAKNGIDIIAHFADDFTGRKLDRPGFNRVRKYIRDGLANCLIVYKADRLSRHRTHTMMVIDELESAGCELHLATKGAVDLEDDTAVLVLSIEGHIAHGEINTIVERTKRGRRKRAKEGQAMAARAPYGFEIKRVAEYTPNGRRIVTDRFFSIKPDESEQVKLIFELFTFKEYSYNAIARHLNGLGYQYRTARPWNAHHISHIIPHTAYKGELSYAGIITPIEPIIDSELWDMAQQKRKHNKKHKRWSSSNYLLSGRVHCFHCGYLIAGTSGGYRCTCAYGNVASQNERGNLCKIRHYYQADRIERVLMAWLYKVLTDKKTLKKGLADYVEEQQQQYKPMLDDLDRVDKLLTRKRAAKDRLVDAYLDGVFDKETVQARQLQLDEEIKSAIQVQAELEQKVEKVKNLPKVVKNIDELHHKVKIAFGKGIAKDKEREIVQALEIECKLEYTEGKEWLHVTGVAGRRSLDTSSNVYSIS